MRKRPQRCSLANPQVCFGSRLGITALLLLEHPVHGARKISCAENMNGCVRNVFEQLAGGEVLMVLVRKTGAIVGARHEDFKSKPLSDVERAKLAHRPTHRVRKICDSLSERTWKPGGEESVQYASPGHGRNSSQSRKNSELIQSAHRPEVEKSGTIPATREA